MDSVVLALLYSVFIVVVLLNSVTVVISTVDFIKYRDRDAIRLLAKSILVGVVSMGAIGTMIIHRVMGLFS